MHLKSLVRAAASAFLATAALCAAPAQATTLALTIDAAWHAFDVDELTALSTSSPLEWIDLTDGSTLSFTFSGPALLRVVDGAFAGDRFQVFDNGVSLGETSAATNSYPNSRVLDFDAAYADSNYSRGDYLLGAGDHLLSGLLSASATDDLGNAFNATVGAVQLLALPVPGNGTVPEPAPWTLLFAGLGLAGVIARRRNA